MRSVFWIRGTGVLAALFAASFFSFPSFPKSSSLNSRPPVSVNHELKGDRLPSIGRALSPYEFGSPALPGKIPLGCDAAFSSISSPHLAKVFRRCLA